MTTEINIYDPEINLNFSYGYQNLTLESIFHAESIGAI